MVPGREEPASPVTPLKRRSFATTHWGVVLATRDAEPDRARQALERLCATYWYPVYACIRRFGQLCREEVAHTVDDPTAVDEELRYLMRVIAQ